MRKQSAGLTAGLVLLGVGTYLLASAHDSGGRIAGGLCALFGFLALLPWLQLWLIGYTFGAVARWRRVDSKALALHRAHKFSEAEGHYQEALKIAEASKQPLLIANACNNLAGAYWDQRRFAEAEPLLVRALQLREAEAGVLDERTNVSRGRLLDCYVAAERWPEAEMLLHNSLALVEKDGAIPDAIVLNKLGVVYRNQGKYEEAEEQYRRAVALAEAEPGNDAKLGEIFNNWGYLEAERVKWAEAEALYLKAMPLREAAGDDGNTAVTLDLLATAYDAQGKLVEAADCSRRWAVLVEEVLKRTGREADSALAPVLERTATALRKAGQEEEAGDLEGRARQIQAANPEAVGISNSAMS